MKWCGRFLLTILVSLSLLFFGEGKEIGAAYQQQRRIRFNFTEDYGARSVFVPLGLDDKIKLNPQDFSDPKAVISLYPLDLDGLLDALIYSSPGEEVQSYFKRRQLQWSNFDFDSALPVTSVTLDQLAGRNYELDVPAATGAWWIRAVDAGQEQFALVTRSSFATMAKNGDENLTLWSQDLASGSGNISGQVFVYNLQDGVHALDEISFPSNGIATVPYSENADALVVVTANGWDFIPLAIQDVELGSLWTAGGSYSIYHADANNYVFTDKPLYQRGDTVYFKAFLRREDDARYSVPREPVSVKITHSGKNGEVTDWAQTYTPDEYGGIDGSWKIGENADLTDYYLSVGGEHRYSNSTWFEVREYVKPEYELILDVDEDTLVTGENVNAHVRGTSFAGHDMNGSSVSYCFKQGYTWGGDDDNEDCQWHALTLGENGELDWEIKTGLPKQEDKREELGTTQLYYTLFVRYSDGLSEPAEDFKVVKINYTPFEIKTSDTNKGFQVGSGMEMTGKINSIRGEVSAANRRMTATIILRDPDHYEQFLELTTLESRTDADGNFSFGYRPSTCDNRSVIYKVYDENGHFQAAYDWFYCDGNSGSDYGLDGSGNGVSSDPDSALKIVIDKDKKHVPSEKINVSYEVGKNLVGRQYFADFGRQRLDRYSIGTFHQSPDQVAYEAVDTDQPNTFHDVSLFDRNNYISSTSGVDMARDLKKINVEITTDKEIYNPGDSVKVKVKTTNAYTGKPLSASVTLWTIDKALLELAASHRGDIFSRYWSERHHWIRTYHSLQSIMLFGAEGGGGDGSELRDVFKDTAYWNPKIITDSNGEASTEFVMPDNLTTWALTGVAVTPETVVGESKQEVVTQKDVVSRVIAPERMRVGDILHLGFSVTNYTGVTQSFVPVWEAGEGLQTLENFPSSLTLTAGETKNITVPVKAISEMPATKITTGVRNVSSGGSGDVLVKTLQILPFGYSQKTSQFSLHAGEFDLGVAPDSERERSSVSISVAADLLSSLRSAMKDLLEYPRGCVEQVTSRLVPALAAHDSDYFSSEDFDGVDIDQLIETGVKNLTSLQQSSGGWGFWNKTRGDASAFRTTYVVKHLPQDQTPVQARAAQFLADTLQGKYSAAGERLSSADLISSVYGLLLLGESSQTVTIEGKSASSFDAALQYYDQMNAAATTDVDLLSWMVQANLLAGDREAASHNVTRLLRAMENDNIDLTSSEAQRYRSVPADLALTIQAVLAYHQEYGGYQQQLEKLVTQLLGYRREAGWANTYESATAIEALMAWYEYAVPQDVGGSYVILAGEQTIGMADFNSGIDREKHFTVNLADLPGDVNTITVRRTDDGADAPVYVTVSVDQWRTSTNSPRENKKLNIYKAYVRTEKTGEDIKAGDIVTVYLGIENKGQTQYFVNIDDYLPSNLRPLLRENNVWANRTFNFTGFNGTLYEVKRGMTIVSYQAVLTNLAQTVSAPPTRVGSMYDADFVAQTAMTDKIQILDKQPAWISKADETYADEQETLISKPEGSTGAWILLAVATVAIIAGVVTIIRKNRRPPTPPPVITPEVMARQEEVVETAQKVAADSDEVSGGETKPVIR